MPVLTVKQDVEILIALHTTRSAVDLTNQLTSNQLTK